MDLLKALKTTTIISATALLALGATEARAALDTSVQGHISASLQGTLGVTEVSAINFGNFSLTGCAPCTNGDATLTLSEKGNRTKVDGAAESFTLLVGTQNGANDAAGVADGSNLGTGGQAPGFYTITNADSISNVYVSFANSTGQIVDSNHPSNNVTLGGPVAGAFTVDTFTWEKDSGTTGYAGTANTADIYGNYVNCGATCNIRVGAKMHTVATKSPTPGQYTGTYYLMVSY